MKNKHLTISENFISDIRNIIGQARTNAVRSVEFYRVQMYWTLGERIFNEEQQGKERADYGAYLIKGLAEQLEPEFGSGFSVRTLEQSRQFYRTFPIANALRSQLNWTQYRSLIKIDSPDKREFYTAEAIKNNWTSRQLDRQIHTALYERLLKSNNKADVLAVARGEKQASDAREIIKDPMFVEFLGLKPNSNIYETDLETAIINHLQEFLLELGNGFSFVARQKRLHIEGDEFFADLVFYNRLLQCFIIIEIK